MKIFVKIFNDWEPLIIFTKSSILDVHLSFEYASVKPAWSNLNPDFLLGILYESLKMNGSN